MRGFLLTCGIVLVGSVYSFAFQPETQSFNWQNQVPKHSVRHFTTDDGLPVNSIHDVLAHSDGYLYFATFDGLVRYDGHRFKVYNTTNTPALKRNRIAEILPAPDDAIWIRDTSNNLYLFKKGEMISYQKHIHDKAIPVFHIQITPAKKLIAFTNVGTWKQTSGTDFTRFDSVSYADYEEIPRSKYARLKTAVNLPEEITINNTPIGDLANLNEAAIDREGNYWMPTGTNGIYQVVPKTMITIGKDTHRGLYNMYGMFPDSSGSIWASGFNHGIFRFRDSVLTVWSKENNTLPREAMRTFTRVDNGELYVGGLGGIWKFDNNRWITASNHPLRVDVLYQDSKQRFWVGSNRGLYRVQQGKVSEFSDPKGNTIQQTKAIKETADGSLVFATTGQGIAFLKRNNEFAFLTTEHGLSSNLFRDVYVASEDTLWGVSEDLGLNRVILNDAYTIQEVKVVTTEDGLIDNSLHRLIEDQYGYFWINSNSGIIRIREKALNDYLDGSLAELPLKFFTSAGGQLINSEGNGGAQYAGLLTDDGKLLFPSQAGIVYTRPEWHLNTGLEKLAEPRAERLMFSDSTVSLTGKTNARLPKTARDVQIKFTLPTFTHPDQLILEYKMKGINDRWHRVGVERLAVFTNLPAGNHTFMMRGKMPMQSSYSEAAITVYIPPLFYETIWFDLFLVLGLLFLVAGIVFVLNKRAQRREEKLNELIAQRTREVVEEKEKTELALERLRNLDESKSRFFANFTHELRTPLSLILNPLNEMLENESKRQENGVEDLTMMQRNAKRLKDLVNRLLDVSRLNSGELSLTFEPVDVEQLTKRIGSQFEHSFSQKNIRFLIEADKQIPDLHLDVGAWEDISTNLLGNSLKFTDEGGEVIVKIRNNSNTVEVSFKDTGLGIPEEDQPYIFDQYYQGDSSISKAGGTGIGLALVKGLVERMGGKITLNRDLEKGTEFIISLKKGTGYIDSADEIIENKRSLDHAITPPSYTTEDIERAAMDEQSNGSYKVLLVEDNEDFRGYLHNVIQREYQVKAASDGKEGLEILTYYQPDIIVSDIMMPEMDGYEMMKAIRDLEAYRHIPFIFLSAKDSPYDIEEGLNSGADIYLTKPVENNVLLTQIKVLLRREEYLRDSEEEEETSSPFVRKVRKIIQRHLGNPDLSTELIANSLSISRSTLYRRWNKGSEETISEMINSMRLKEALRLIEDEGLTISEAAYATGYNHLTYFSRVFKKVYGMTARKYVNKE